MSLLNKIKRELLRRSISFGCSADLSEAIVADARLRKMDVNQLAQLIVQRHYFPTEEDAIARLEELEASTIDNPPYLQPLRDYLLQIPSIIRVSGHERKGLWNLILDFDYQSPVFLHVIQYFAFIFNWYSATETLPTSFYPISAPPYLNGGPEDCLGWKIESLDNGFTPQIALEILQSRLLNPVISETSWLDT